MDIPSVDEIRAMHMKHAPHEEAFDLVFTHCEIVWKVAERIISLSGWDVDPELVRAGCLLHDIGVYRLYDADGRMGGQNYVRHGLLGHEILEAEGLPEELCRFCSCHTGVGLTKEDILAQGLPLPPADYIAVTPEEQLVMYADKFHSKTTPPKFVSPKTYAAYVGRFGRGKVEAFEALCARFGAPELEALAASYGHALT
ncbi:HD domain-containing protein [Streptomyces sp. TLI_105]|uniref:HD domain-containing protein n=1 Tax=Streptomyces sp. TLI_105 TaxID=1881019 RepID=UPI000B864483|nr:HD domain-containing protein [Streptomyces sp. TLI_105]